jgi:hypothetical protein
MIYDRSSLAHEGRGQVTAYATTDENAADDLRPRINARLRCPCKPEETYDQNDTTGYHCRKTLFRNNFLGFDKLRCEDDFSLLRQGSAGDGYTDEDSDERK